MFNNLFGKKDEAHYDAENPLVVYVEGMSCKHCLASVENALKSLKGVTSVEVDLPTGKAVLQGSVDVKSVRKAVEGAGFKLKD